MILENICGVRKRLKSRNLIALILGADMMQQWCLWKTADE